LRRSADLMTTMLRQFVNDYSQYEGQETFEDAAVIRLENGTVRWPVGFREGDLPLPEGFPEMESDLYDAQMDLDGAKQDVTIAVRQICTDTWYLEWTSKEEETYYTDIHMPMSSHLAAIEAVSGSWFVLVDSDDYDRSVYNPMEFSSELIRAAAETAGDREPGYLSDSYRSYHIHVRELEQNDKTLILFYPTDNMLSAQRSEAFVVGAIVFLILATLYVWLISTERMVYFHILTKPQTIRYNPGAIRRRTAAAGGFCLILLFIASLFVRTAGTLYQESTESAQMLFDYENSIKAMTITDTTAGEEDREWVLYYARKTAEMLSVYPQLIDHVRLATMAADIGAEYIMVFDENGNETACSGDYINFTLGADENDPLYTFRRINKGLEYVITEPAPDIILAAETSLVGWRMKLPETDGYGVLLLSLDAGSVTPEDPAEDELRLMNAASYDGSMIFSLNAEKTAIENSTGGYFRGVDLETAGLKESALRESDMCMFTLFGSEYNGASRLIDGRLHYCGSAKETLNDTSMSFALLATALGFGSFVLLALWLLSGYNKETFDRLAVVGTEAVRGSSVEVITADGRIKRSRDPSRRSEISLDAWRDLLPENKTKITAQCILFLFLALVMGLVWYNNGRQDMLITYLLAGSWEKGFNVLALCANLLLAAAVSLALLLIRVLIRLACSWLDTKGETILRLLYSLLEYIAVFTLLFYSFANFGIDTSALLTTMGLLSLAVSIGSRDLVADVIAGITIVFEGDYQVGDIVEIDGYRGKVQEIGVRSTKIMGMGDNIKTINNRDVRNVINTTRFNSWYAMTLNISSTYDLNKLEEILERELPEIRNKVKKIISGPVYKGVESIGKDSFKITLLTECREEDYRRVQRQVNREIRLLFDREGIPII
ncbi:MAG: mechanosensitive ion channel, partial [Erysipelotrichaceae bacterium]|nr:mechanosensitive ion channel [Erysipelotrichaceae bacterium]